MPLSAKGVYHDTSGKIFYYGYRQQNDITGLTWREASSLSIEENSLLVNYEFDDLIWNGTQVILDFVPLDRAKEEKVAEIKAEAQRQILKLAPEWKQRNMIARVVELMQLGQTTDPEFVAIQDIWDSIKAIRATSDQLEVAVNATTTEAEVDAVNWPSA